MTRATSLLLIATLGACGGLSEREMNVSAAGVCPPLSAAPVGDAVCSDAVVASGEYCHVDRKLPWGTTGELGGIAVDVDFDGDMDVVAGTGIALNDGRGFFSRGATLPGGSYIAVAELDSVAGYEVILPSSEAITVVHLDNAGRAQAETSYDYEGEGAYAVAAGNIGGGQEPEVVAVGIFDQFLRVYDNIDGQLLLRPLIDSGRGDNRQVHLADLNGDSRLDVVIAGSGGFRVLLGSEDGQFGSVQTVASRSFTTLKLYDVNRDCVLDAVGSAPNSATALVFHGDGQGGFEAPIELALGVDAWVVALGDFDNNGTVDLMATAYEQEGALGLLLGKKDGSFAPPTLHSFQTRAHDLIVADFNQDGVEDVFALGRERTVILSNP